MMKKTSLIALISLAVLSASAQTNVLDSWTFTSVTPQKSDLKNKTMGNWDPALPGNSVPSAGRLRDATAGNSTGAWYGDHLGLAERPDSLTVALSIADINHTSRLYFFEFLGDVGGNNMRGEINASGGGNIFFDVEGGGTALKDVAAGYGSLFNVGDYTGAISLDVSYTWDFVNNTLSYTVSGDGLGYTGAGDSAFSDTKTVNVDLSGITNVKSFRVRGGTVEAGEYIDLDSVTLSTAVVPEPSTVALMGGLTTLGLVLLRRRRA